MSLHTLDEKQKEMAAEILRGTPRTEIARRLGIARETVYNWLKDPLFQAYLNQLREDLQAVRRERLTPISLKAAEVLEAYLARLLRDAATVENPLPTLEAVMKLTKQLSELERSERDVSPAAVRAPVKKAGALGGGVPAIGPGLLPVTSGSEEGTP